MTLQEMLTIAMRYQNKQSDALIIACYEAAFERNEHLTTTRREGGDTDGNDNRLPGQSPPGR
jgi:hypothetical protein